MVRRIVAIVAGIVIALLIALIAGGLATSVFGLHGLETADPYHPAAALPTGGIALFALGALVGGFAGAYVAVRFGQWAPAAWIVAVAAMLYALSTAALFANFGFVVIVCAVAAIVGCWIGGRLAATV